LTLGVNPEIIELLGLNTAETGGTMNVVNIADAPKTKNEKLDDFCRALADGKNREEAYAEAGYSGHNCRANAHKYYRQNAEYIQAYLSEHITTHVPMALNVILKIAADPNEKGGIRLKAAQDIMDRGGFGAKQKIELTTKDAKEMSTEELQNEVAKALIEHPFLAALITASKSVGE
jgi:hypothetical protein